MAGASGVGLSLQGARSSRSLAARKRQKMGGGGAMASQAKAPTQGLTKETWAKSQPASCFQCSGRELTTERQTGSHLWVLGLYSIRSRPFGKIPGR